MVPDPCRPSPRMSCSSRCTTPQVGRSTDPCNPRRRFAPRSRMSKPFSAPTRRMTRALPVFPRAPRGALLHRRDVRADRRRRAHSSSRFDGDGRSRSSPPACDVIDEAATWDVHLVSARVVHGVSGHDGEWFSVRAGRARARHRDRREATSPRGSQAAIDAELAREHAVLVETRRAAMRSSSCSASRRSRTTSAISRASSTRGPPSPRTPHYVQHTRVSAMTASARFGDAFVRAGVLNKAVMADENHRFLALRKPRGLRRSRELLLPIGPFFDDWGETIARPPRSTSAIAPRSSRRSSASTRSPPEQRGCLRALAGHSGKHSGGPRALEHLLPARTRKVLSSGPLRDALKTPREVFEARMRKRSARSAH